MILILAPFELPRNFANIYNRCLSNNWCKKQPINASTIIIVDGQLISLFRQETVNMLVDGISNAHRRVS